MAGRKWHSCFMLSFDRRGGLYAASMARVIAAKLDLAAKDRPTETGPDPNQTASMLYLGCGGFYAKDRKSTFALAAGGALSFRYRMRTPRQIRDLLLDCE